MDDRETKEQSRDQIVDLAAALKESMIREAEAKYPVRAGAKASRGKRDDVERVADEERERGVFGGSSSLTIANLTDHDVEVRIIPSEPIEPYLDRHPELAECLSEAEYNRLTAALAADPGLEHALAVAEEVGIGPSEAPLLPDELHRLIDETPWPELTGDEDASAFVDHLERERKPEVDLHSTADAKVWAQEFMRVLRAAPFPALDEDLMLAWFANAIMVGWDRGRIRLLEEQAADAAKKPTDPPPPTEPRFGDRLRAALIPAPGMQLGPEFIRRELLAIADAIDQDVTEAAGVQAGRSLLHLTEAEEKARYYERLWVEHLGRPRIEQADLRRKIEQLVEELRCSAYLPPQNHRDHRRVDILEAEPFLERLAAIFGGQS